MKYQKKKKKKRFFFRILSVGVVIGALRLVPSLFSLLNLVADTGLFYYYYYYYYYFNYSIYMKYQTLFSLKNEKKKKKGVLECCLLLL